MTPETWEVHRCWRLARGGGMGAGPLPDPGGVLQQPAVLLDAFDVLDAAFEAQRVGDAS